MIFFAGLAFAAGATTPDAFHKGAEAYVAGAFDQAAELFGEAAKVAPSAGALHNLGNAEWKRGRPGVAILAWERARWLDPFNKGTKTNLRYARRAAQLDAPELAWYEVCSTWLPANVWALIACLTFWLAVGLVTLPSVLRWKKGDWHQGVAAACFAIFLLTLPALAGVESRSRLGIVLAKDTPLRLTPTANAQVMAKLPAGETARLEQDRGNYIFIRTSTAAGWVEKTQVGRVAG